MKKLAIFTLCFASTLISFGAFAQEEAPSEGKSGMPPRPSDEQIAKMMTDEMQRDLGINDNQYKKIYKINLQQIKKQTSASNQKQSSSNAGDMDMMGGGMEMGGGPGGGMGGGPMGGGMGGGPSGGMGGGMGGGSRGGRPSVSGTTPDADNANIHKGGNRPPVQFKETEETLEYKAQKFKKILTPEQYNKWIKKEREKLNREFWKTNPNENEEELTTPTKTPGKKAA